MFELFKSFRKTAVAVPAPTPELKYVPPVILKTRKWVWVKGDNGGIGIIASLKNYGTAEIHYVDEHGQTVRVDHSVMIGNLRLAKYEEIPEVRRKNLTSERARTLGYY